MSGSSSNTVPRGASGDPAFDYLRVDILLDRMMLTVAGSVPFDPCQKSIKSACIIPLVAVADQPFQFRNLLQISGDTIVLDRDIRYKMLGAQNLNGITCFLNATLFAMFCRSDSCFDTLLYSAFDGLVGRFATMVRLWVNMVST